MSASRRLPNFSALRAFEAAARHENFSRAAEELRLTHGAISHQVKALEQELGRALFVRHGRQVKITHEGRTFAAFLGKTFDEVAAAADALRARSNARLVVAAPAWFAARWLTPRLGTFIEAHPEVELVVRMGATVQALAGGEADVGLVFDAGRLPGLRLEYLMGEVRVDVVSAHYHHEAPALQATEPMALLTAVLAGQGAALLPQAMVAAELAAGRLLRRQGAAVRCEEAYYLAMMPGMAELPQVAAWRRWLHGEVAAYQRQHGLT